MAALGLVHVVRGHQQRGAGIGEFEELSQKSRRDFGSTALVGSSRNSSSGWWITAPASARRCFCPPLIVPASCFWRSWKWYCSTSSSILRLACTRGMSCTAARNSRFSRTVRSSNSEPPGSCSRCGCAVARPVPGCADQHFDVARRRREQSTQHADGGGFSGAVRAEEAIDMTTRNVQIDIVHRHQCAEALGQATDTDRASFLTRRHRTPPAAGPPPRPAASFPRLISAR